MKRFMLWVLAVCGLMTSAAFAQQDLSGNWQGTVQLGRDIRAVLKVSKAGSGWKGQMFNADQPMPPLSVPAITLQGPAVHFSVNAMNADFDGTLNPDGNSISGSLTTQDHQKHPLTLQRVSEENTWAIPQPPKPMPADAQPKLDVVSVKPSDPNRPGKLFTLRGSHFVTINTTTRDLLTFAYSLNPKQVVNMPDWFGEDKFDVDGVPDVQGQPNSQQMRLLGQDVLAQRFKLAFHHEMRELSVYALTVAKGGPKMTVTQDDPSAPRNFLFGGLGKLNVTNNSMQDFCNGMQGAVMDKPVVDQTGLKDRYDFKLNWAPDQSQFAQMGAHIQPATDDPNAPPSLYTALQEQLGLKLESTKAVTDVIVIDHIEKPSAN